MRIVLPGALPEPREARELLPHLLKAAPTLAAWLARSHATRIVADPAHTYCTAWEYWTLLQHGFRPDDGQVVSTGLGPLLSGFSSAAPDDPVWLVELTHLSPSRDGAVLIPACELDVTPEDSEVLFQTARSLFADTSFTVHPCSTIHWRVTLPDDYAPSCPSPNLVSTSTVNDWWRQDLAGRPWRRLANELQMLWFDHPVNQARYARNQVPINSVWLFGGARATQFDVHPAAPSADTHVDERLLAPLLAQDWGSWLQIVHELDADLFPSLNRQSELILIGTDQFITCTTDNRFWKHWLPGTKESWKKWWSPQS